MKILLDIHVTVTFLRAFQPSAGLSHWKIGTRQTCMEWLLIIRHVNSVNYVNSANSVNLVNSVNSVNSCSAVLPPSPMVFFCTANMDVHDPWVRCHCCHVQRSDYLILTILSQTMPWSMIVNNMPKPLNTKGIAADFDVLRASAHGRAKGSC